MAKDELNHKNFVRINRINWLLTPILMFFFAWPFHELSVMFSLNKELAILASFLFSFGFTVTILHGHVTIALGNAHRHLYYIWLDEHSLSYGLFFHKSLVSTRIRLLSFVLAVALFLLGYFSQL